MGWRWCVPWLLVPKQARGRVAYSTGRQANQTQRRRAVWMHARRGSNVVVMGNGQWAALRWMGARRELTVAEGA